LYTYTALSISVGGRCPITCNEAINVAQQASSQNGCDSDEFIEAENTAVALCGAFEYTQRTGDFGICPPETTPTCEGTVQALARVSYEESRESRGFVCVSLSRSGIQYLMLDNYLTNNNPPAPLSFFI
jgi:hypothetical protein